MSQRSVLSPKEAEVLVNFAKMIRKFDDSAFMGEVIATIADKLEDLAGRERDAMRKVSWRKVIDQLALAIDQVETFGEDTDWQDWEAFLDSVYEASLPAQRQMASEMALVMADPLWVKGLLELNRERVDFAKAVRALQAADAAWPGS